LPKFPMLGGTNPHCLLANVPPTYSTHLEAVCLHPTIINAMKIGKTKIRNYSEKKC
jgi:hypothetical protein